MKVSATGSGFGVLLGVILLIVVSLFLGGLFWGWVIMLVYPLFSTGTIGLFWTAFWWGVLVSIVINVLKS